MIVRDCSTVTGANPRIARREQEESTSDPLHDDALAPNSANGPISSLIAWTEPKPPGNAATVSIVRLINKFPDPPNKDVGEGLNTAFSAMREMKLKPPIITQLGNNVMVTLRHEPLATPGELILEFLYANEQITNKIAREITFIGSENKMKRVFQKMMDRNLIELVPGTTRYTAAYRLVKTLNSEGPL